MRTKNLITATIIALIALLLSCEANNKTVEWVPALDETTVYGLTGKITVMRKSLENFQQFQKKGQRAKANEQLAKLSKGLENMEIYFLPLTNAKAHLSSSYKLTLRKDFTTAKEEFNKSQQLISGIKANASGNVLKDTNDLLVIYNKLEKELDSSKKDLQPIFVEAAEKLTGLIYKKLQ